MPARRSRASHALEYLPRVVVRHGSYFWIEPGSRRFHKLARVGEEIDALNRYGQLTLNNTPKLTTLGAVLDRYEREVLPTKAPRTQRDQRAELARLRKVFGHMSPEDVTPADVYAYMDRRPPVRANREVALLSHVFTKAVRWGASSNPCKLVERNKERPRDRYVTDEEYAKVYEVASPVIRVAMTLALLTGLRLGDLLRLTRQNMTGEGLLVEQGKSRRKLLIEWTPGLRAAVRQGLALRDVSSMYIIPSQSGMKYTESGFKAMWKRVKAKAGATWTFHDLRAKSASDHETGAHLGHIDARTRERVYRRAPTRVRPLSRAD